MSVPEAPYYLNGDKPVILDVEIGSTQGGIITVDLGEHRLVTEREFAVKELDLSSDGRIDLKDQLLEITSTVERLRDTNDPLNLTYRLLGGEELLERTEFARDSIRAKFAIRIQFKSRQLS